MTDLFVHHYLDRSAALYPQKTALTDGRNTLTFGELAAASDQLARFFAAHGVGNGERVVYFLKRSLDCIIATLGILKCGAAYVPLDQKTPPERWHRIVADAAPRAILCSVLTLPETLERIKTLETAPLVVCLGPLPEQRPAGVFFQADIDSVSETHLREIGNPDDTACVLYTSGSTGAPKGVMVTHGNIRNYIDWALEYFEISTADRILGTAPFYFDMSTFDIFCALASGAALCIATDDLLLFPEKLVRFMEQEQVTLWKGVSSLLMYLCRAGVLRPGRMPALRTVIFAGEPLDARYLRQWMQTFPEKSFYNGYGPTEATGISLCYPVQQLPVAGQPIPIGKPCKGAQAILVDDDDQQVAPGQVGELCIAGECLAKGYLNDPEKTRSRFTPPPVWIHQIGDRIYRTGDLCRQTPDGDYVFVCRKDHQVKWMGYRIELGEIETHLTSYPCVKGAVALLADTGKDGLTELTAFLETEHDIDPLALTRFLEKRIPPYMIPRRFIRLESIPRNDRGKIDREEILRRYSRRLQ